MTTEIRDEWLVEMQKNGRAERYEIRLMAQELIEMRKLYNLNLGPTPNLNIFVADRTDKDRLVWADWVIAHAKDMRVRDERSIINSNDYQFFMVRKR